MMASDVVKKEGLQHRHSARREKAQHTAFSALFGSVLCVSAPFENRSREKLRV